MILIVEDSSTSKDFVYNLMQLGYALNWVNNMYDAVYYIETEPGYRAFCAVILDTDMSEEGLPKDALDEAQETYSGYAFYKHVLKVSPELQEKTIVFSGFTEQLKEKISKEKYDKLKIVRKGDKDHLAIIIETLKGWGIEPERKKLLQT